MKPDKKRPISNIKKQVASRFVDTGGEATVVRKTGTSKTKPSK